MDELTFKDLDRWERYYLLKSARYTKPVVYIPRRSKVADRMIEHGLLKPSGIVVGQNACWILTQYGQRVVAEHLNS